MRPEPSRAQALSCNRLTLPAFSPTLADSAVFDTPPAATGSSDLLVSLIRSLSRPLPESAPTENGAPHVLILAASGQRCADLVRELRPLLGPLEKPAAEDKVGASKKQGEKKGGKPAKKAKVEAPLKPKNGEVAKVRRLDGRSGRSTGNFNPG